MDYLIVLIFFAVIAATAFGFLGMWIGGLGGKGNEQTGFILGALLGPIGLIIAAIIPANNQESSKTADQSDAARIARLEAELAALKRNGQQPGSRPAKPLMPKRDEESEGTVPTYRLD